MYDDNRLRVGDILFLQKGMMVGCHGVPRKVLNHCYSPFDVETADGHMKLGHEYLSRQDVFEERTQIRDKIINLFKEMLIPLNISILDRFLFNQIREQPAARVMLPAGRYVVTKIKKDQGTRWVYCQEMYGDDPPVEIFFWQGPYGGRSAITHNDIVPERGIR